MPNPRLAILRCPCISHAVLHRCTRFVGGKLCCCVGKWRVEPDSTTRAAAARATIVPATLHHTLSTNIVKNLLMPLCFVGRLIFIHHHCWEVLLFLTIQRQRCMKILCPKDPEFYTPLVLTCQKRSAPPSTGGVLKSVLPSMGCFPGDFQEAKRPLSGALRKGPPFHGSRSSREIRVQNASCQLGGREVTR